MGKTKDPGFEIIYVEIYFFHTYVYHVIMFFYGFGVGHILNAHGDILKHAYKYFYLCKLQYGLQYLAPHIYIVVGHIRQYIS